MDIIMEKYTEIIIFFLSTLWAVALWYLNRKERGTRIRKDESEAMATMQSTVDKLTEDITDLSLKYSGILAEIRKRDEQLYELEEKYNKLKKDYNRLLAVNRDLRKILIENEIPHNGQS